MFARMIAIFAAAALLISTAGTRPAAADDQDLLRALAAIAGIAIVGKVIKDRRDDRAVTQYQPYSGYDQADRFNDRLEPRPLPYQANRRLLPGDCLRSFETRRGKVRMFGRRCLEKSKYNVRRLPQHCAVRIPTDRGLRSGFEARCLRHEGYQLARR